MSSDEFWKNSRRVFYKTSTSGFSFSLNARNSLHVQIISTHEKKCCQIDTQGSVTVSCGLKWSWSDTSPVVFSDNTSVWEVKFLKLTWSQCCGVLLTSCWELLGVWVHTESMLHWWPQGFTHFVSNAMRGYMCKRHLYFYSMYYTEETKVQELFYLKKCECVCVYYIDLCIDTYIS